MEMTRCKSLSAWALSFVFLGAAPGLATAHDGFYLGIEGGANFVFDQTLRIYGANRPLRPIPDGTPVSTVGFDTGFAAGFFGGYAFENGFNLELEIAHRDNVLGDVTLANGEPSQRVGGHEFAVAAFGNVWYEFLKGYRLRPYLGGGAGYARVAIRDPEVDNLPGFQDGSNLRSDFDAVFAFQAGGGLRYDLTPKLTASVDYRFVRSNVGSFDLLENNPDSEVQTRYKSHTALLSLRYHFGGGKPPIASSPVEPVQVVPVEETPVEAPAEAPAEVAAEPAPPKPRCQPSADGGKIDLADCEVGDVFVLRGVNFETNKATLTVNAKTLLDDVVVALKARPDIKVAVQGHTDSRGSDAYNLRLSQRRATTVRSYLIGKGIDAARMTSVGLGETMPVADNETDEGRELNRRVELKVVDRAAPAAAAEPAPAP